jgi:hypothetical protein
MRVRVSAMVRTEFELEVGTAAGDTPEMQRRKAEAQTVQQFAQTTAGNGREVDWATLRLEHLTEPDG